MRFKEFLYLFEALSPEVQGILQKSKFPVAQDLVAQAIKDLNAELDAAGKVITDKGEAFKLLRQKLGLEKKAEVPAPEEAVLKPFYKQLLDKEITLPEYKTAMHFKKSNPAELSLMMTELRAILAGNKAELLYKDKPELVFRGETFDNFKNLQDFSSKIHGIEAATQPKVAGFENFRDPIVADLRHQGTQVWPPSGSKTNPSKIYIFKGDSFLKCKYFGKGAPWCVTKNPTHFYSYRMRNKQTQYFIIDYNKKPNDPARYTNPGVSSEAGDSEYVDLDNRPTEIDPSGSRFGINGHKDITEYLNYLEKMGVENPKELLKPEPITKHEAEMYKMSKSPDNLKWARSKGPQVTKEYLSSIGANGLSLSVSDFKSLSDSEKYDYMVETGKEPANGDEAKYLSSLSRKDYKEYIGSYENDFVSRDDHAKKQKLLLAMKSGEALDEESEKLLDSLIANTTHRTDYSILGAGKDGQIPLDYLLKIVEKEHARNTVDTSIGKQTLDTIRNASLIRPVYKQIFVPLLKDKKTPIEAYNFLMKNLDKFEKAEPDFLIKFLGNRDLFTISSTTDETFNKNYMNLKRMIFRNLTDEQKKAVLHEADLDTNDYLDKNIHLRDSLIRNLQDLKDIYALIGKRIWMYNSGNVFENLSKDDHDWVLKHLGEDAFDYVPRFSQEIARKHFKHGSEIANPVIEKYLDTMGMAKTLEYLKKETKFIDRVSDTIRKNNCSNGKDCETLAALIQHASIAHEIDLLLKYFPREVIFSPWTIQRVIERTGILSHRASNRQVDLLKEFGKYLTDEEVENAIKNPIFRLGNGNIPSHAFELVHGMRKEAPQIFNIISNFLTRADLANFLEVAPPDYLQLVATEEKLKEAPVQAFYGMVRNALTGYIHAIADRSVASEKHEDTTPYDEKAEMYEKLLEKMTKIDLLYQEDVFPYLLKYKHRLNYDNNTPEQYKDKDPIIKNMPPEALPAYLYHRSDKDATTLWAYSDVDTFLSILQEKLKGLPFDKFLNLWNTTDRHHGVKPLLNNYVKANGNITDEQFEELFKNVTKNRFKGNQDVIWQLLPLQDLNPDLFEKMAEKYENDYNLSSIGSYAKQMSDQRNRNLSR
jgi:hypothetical protein